MPYFATSPFPHVCVCVSDFIDAGRDMWIRMEVDHHKGGSVASRHFYIEQNAVIF